MYGSDGWIHMCVYYINKTSEAETLWVQYFLSQEACLIWFGVIQSKRWEVCYIKELTLDGNPKTQNCLFPVSILSEVILPKQNLILCPKDQQLSILINESWSL